MMTFTAKYGVGQLVEYDCPEMDHEFAHGFVHAVRFRKSDAVNFCAEYMIKRCNEEKFDVDVREDQIKAQFNRVTT